MRVVVMGVSGAGKTTVGRLVADQLGYEFIDADDHHSPENIEKMSRGVALTDADREPWLEKLRTILANRHDVVLACSALKAAYRERLSIDDTLFVYLKIDRDEAASRLRSRAGHFFDPSLLDTQFATLEEQSDALTIDAALDPEVAAVEVLRKIASK